MVECRGRAASAFFGTADAHSNGAERQVQGFAETRPQPGLERGICSKNSPTLDFLSVGADTAFSGRSSAGPQWVWPRNMRICWGREAKTAGYFLIGARTAGCP